MKGIETIHCLQGANPVYHRGKGPLGGTLAFFFLAFCDVMGSQMNRQKKQRSFDWQEKMNKTWGKQPNFVIKVDGKRGSKCLSLSGRSFCVFAPGQTRFLIWVLEFPRLLRFPESFCFLTDFSLEMKTHSCTTWFTNADDEGKGSMTWPAWPPRATMRLPRWKCRRNGGYFPISSMFFFQLIALRALKQLWRSIGRIWHVDKWFWYIYVLLHTSYYIYTAISTICRWHS